MNKRQKGQVALIILSVILLVFWVVFPGNTFYLSLCLVSLFNLFFNNPGTHSKKE